ncbi:hypothetical protein DVH24_013717 [Malus domestica]|uniref:Uncharacterized protein n=1 Tax=Malus domestica TaxID=3750 RepID=A0A498JIC4_MALDO|nr:hypothetical protein DVH24_013717 [Malus domestica]
MAVAELSTPSYTKTHLFQSSQLSSLSTHLHSHRRVAFRPLPHTQNARICCSVAPNNFLVPDVSQVQAPAAPAQTEDPKNKPECFGVFCLTYNLKATIVMLKVGNGQKEKGGEADGHFDDPMHNKEKDRLC